MDRKRLFTLLLSFWCIGAFSQADELVSASGASFQNSSGYISYSIGEVVITTLTSSSAILTQDFHQTRYRTVSILNHSAIQMSVFPNPVKDLLILQIEDPLGFDYLLYDVRGGLLERGQVLDERTEINFSALAPAMYILRVTNYKEEVRLFQIVKY